MKRFILIPLAILLVTALIFGGCAEPAPPAPAPAPAPPIEVIKLKYSSFFLPPEPPNIIAEFFCDYVEKESGGRVKIERFPGGALGSDMEQLELVKSGGSDITTLVNQMFPADLVLSAVISELPFSKAEALANMYELYFENPETAPIIEKEWTRNNIKFLNQNSAGEIGIIATCPVAALTDLQGKKIGALLDQPWFKEYNIEFVSLTIPEVYEGLSRGVIDAMEMVITPMDVLKWYEPSVAYLRLGLNYSSNPEIVNLDTWNNLSPDLQDVFREAAAAAMDFGLGLDDEMAAKTIQTFKDAGLSINVLSKDEQTQLFRLRFAAWEEQWLGFAERAGVSDDAQVVLKTWKDMVYPK